MDLHSAARQLTLEQPSLNFFQAELLLLDAYNRHKSGLTYGNLTQTCMKITWGILLRSSEQELLDRLEKINMGIF